ncbi:AAA family ATPase [Rhizobium sp. C1]|uniref:AAA family ATPase n=1 Tax=Rhizobium sp. C1 TaxID=1349799 RepID=UPI001E6421F0|nr:ATP-binding protein [Rhizobium sp. C1]MCD2178232.1 ATP-binding protein [Rhizobium sp. C1]
MTNPSSIPLADRVARYLVRRLERQAIRNAYEAAEAIGLLERHFGSDELAPNGPICWNIRQPLTLALSGDPVVDRRVIERFLSRRDSSLPEPSPDFEFDDDNERPVVGHTISGRPVRSQRPSALNDKSRRGRSLKALVAQKGSSPVLTRDTGPAKEPKSAASTENGSAGHHAVDRDYVLRLIRAHRTPHHVADVAVALLLASAAGEAFNHIDPLLSLLVRPAPVVVIRSSVAEFERRFGTMLERGAVMPFALSLVDAFGDKSISGSYRDNASDPHRAASISGKRVQDLSSKALREAVAKAFLRKELPIVVVDETTASDFPSRLLAGADVILDTGRLDRGLLADLLHICLNIPPKASLKAMEERAFQPGQLGLDDLALALRPGRSVEKILSILIELSAANDADDDDADGENEWRSRKIRQGSREKQGNLSRDRKHGAFDLTQPEAPPPDKNTKPSTTKYLSVETLAGYGRARDWALDLKADLELWKQGGLAWSEMSTKLLLSGPPGTGKTTFARALCNTIQVPLLATSLSTMLEPGYLGDVLKAMSEAFEIARNNAPSILFIDEIDNIGRRSNGGGRHDEYWNSLINRMLELLDGVAKTEGVIVVAATNFPERIDSALLRSGRLETRVDIPMPDVTALAGILEFHLGSDLTTVIGSRPNPVAVAHNVGHHDVAARQRPKDHGHDAPAASEANRKINLDGGRV